MKNIKHLTLLHSNDLHGDFLSENIDENLIGGVSMLSGYVNDVRRKNPNTLYMIAGDMFRGSLIDSEFQGISTIEIMNALAPDIVSLCPFRFRKLAQGPYWSSYHKRRSYGYVFL